MNVRPGCQRQASSARAAQAPPGYAPGLLLKRQVEPETQAQTLSISEGGCLWTLRCRGSSSRPHQVRQQEAVQAWEAAAPGTLLFSGPGTSPTARGLSFYPEARVLPSLYISICLLQSGWSGRRLSLGGVSLWESIWLWALRMGLGDPGRCRKPEEETLKICFPPWERGA